MTRKLLNHNMNVLHFYKNALPESKGGVETFMDTLCNATADLGVKNTILSLSKNPSDKPIQQLKYQSLQVKEDLLLASTGFSFSAFAKFKQLAEKADIIHYHFPNPFADLLHFTCNIKKPTIVTYHSDIIKQKYLLKLYTPLMNKFLASVDRIVATSPNYFSTSNVLQKFAPKVKVIPIGLNKDHLPPINQEKLRYWQTALPQPFFLFIGALRYYKGLHTALDAVKDTNIQLVLAGIGGIRNELELYARQNNLSNVYFVGSVPDEDKVALLNLCYGFVFPSHVRSEAFGVALLEAAAYGKPLISCEIGTGTSFVNIANETGLVIEPSSPKALKGAMQYLLDNPSKAQEFGKNSENRYKTHFTADKQASAYYQLYQELL